MPRISLFVAALGLVAGCSDAAAPSSSPSVVSVAAAASSASAGSELPLRVEQIRPAVAALEAKLGGAQQYLEVNATPTLVNLFVATDNATHAVAYVYAQGTLSEPAAPEVVKAGAPTFGAADIAFDAARVLAPLLVQLPNSQYRVFSVVGVAGGGVSYLVTVGSAQGGQLEVPVGADGSITGAVQN